MTKELNTKKIKKVRLNKINDFFNLSFNANYIKKLLLNEIIIRNYKIIKNCIDDKEINNEKKMMINKQINY